MQVVHSHSLTKLIKAEFLPAAVEAVIAVPFIYYIMKFGEQEPCYLETLPEFIHHNVVFPCDVYIACASAVTPYSPAFRIHHRLITLYVASNEIIAGSGISLADYFIEKVSPLSGRVVGMPGIEVGDNMIEIARRIVLHEPRRIDRFCPVIPRSYPFLCFRSIGSAFCNRIICEQTPGLIEKNPRENRRMIVVPQYLPFSYVFPVGFRFGIRLSPVIRNILHDQKSVLVGPV